MQPECKSNHGESFESYTTNDKENGMLSSCYAGIYLLLQIMIERLRISGNFQWAKTFMRANRVYFCIASNLLMYMILNWEAKLGILILS